MSAITFYVHGRDGAEPNAARHWWHWGFQIDAAKLQAMNGLDAVAWFLRQQREGIDAARAVCKQFEYHGTTDGFAAPPVDVADAGVKS